jgi:N-acylneuraminate cytidylyltransferase
MNYKNKVKAFILARKGSKRIKSKNLLMINGVPIVKKALLQAIKVFGISNVVVSSDDKRILEICKFFPKKLISNKRPKRFSGDKVKSETVLKYLIKKYDIKEKFIIILQPTSPFRDITDIKKMTQIMIYNNLNTLHSVNEYKIKKKIRKKVIIFKSNKNKVFDNSKKYSYNGAIYIFKQKYFFDKNSIYEKIPNLYLTKNKSSLDIDYLKDLKGLNYKLC